MGIPIADAARHAAAVMRNFDFFGAPLAGIVTMHRDLGPADAVSVGMYLQTLMLALTARGLGTCVEVSVAGVSRRRPNPTEYPARTYNHLRLGGRLL